MLTALKIVDNSVRVINGEPTAGRSQRKGQGRQRSALHQLHPGFHEEQHEYPAALRTSKRD